MRACFSIFCLFLLLLTSACSDSPPQGRVIESLPPTSAQVAQVPTLVEVPGPGPGSGLIETVEPTESEGPTDLDAWSSSLANGSVGVEVPEAEPSELGPGFQMIVNLLNADGELVLSRCLCVGRSTNDFFRVFAGGSMRLSLTSEIYLDIVRAHYASGLQSVFTVSMAQAGLAVSPNDTIPASFLGEITLMQSAGNQVRFFPAKLNGYVVRIVSESVEACEPEFSLGAQRGRWQPQE